MAKKSSSRPRSPVVQAIVSPKTMRKLVQLAKRHDVSVSTFTRRLIENVVRDATAEPQSAAA